MTLGRNTSSTSLCCIWRPWGSAFWVGIRPQQGGLLLEALIGFAILSFSILGLMPAQMAIQAHQQLAQDITQATTLAESEIERLQALPWHNLPPDGQEKIFSDGLMSSGTHFTVTREIHTPQAGWRSITLKVAWRDLSGAPRDMQWEAARSFEPEGWGAQTLSSGMTRWRNE